MKWKWKWKNTDLHNAEVEEEQTGIKDEETELELMAANIKTPLDELIDLGISEEELLKYYEMVHSAEVDYDLEEELDFVVNSFAQSVQFCNSCNVFTIFSPLSNPCLSQEAKIGWLWS